MKIKTVTEFIEKEKNNNQTVYYKTLSGHGHQKRKKKPSLIFFEVEVWNDPAFFFVSSWQAIAKIACRPCPQEISVSCRGMAAHELPLLFEICWLDLSKSVVMMTMVWLTPKYDFEAACDILLHQRLIRNLLPLHTAQQSATIWPTNKAWQLAYHVNVFCGTLPLSAAQVFFWQIAILYKENSNPR